MLLSFIIQFNYAKTPNYKSDLLLILISDTTITVDWGECFKAPPGGEPARTAYESEHESMRLSRYNMITTISHTLSLSLLSPCR